MGADTTLDLDRIERSIDIDAAADTVWTLISRPGWWINEHDVDPNPVLRVEGELTVVVHEKFGEFRLRTLEQRPPRYIAYRWLDTGDDIGTLTEFWIDDREGGVTLRVVESGFCDLGKSREKVIDHVTENTAGWEAELAAAARYVAAAGADPA